MSNGRNRAPLLLLAVLSLLAGLWGGLRRLGWDLPEVRPSLVMAHGPLMVCGFLGTLICLERAVALGRKWGFLGPLAAGLGGVMAIAAVGGPAPYSTVAAWMALAASAVLLATFVDFVRKQPVVSMVVMAVAVVLWIVGNLLWIAGQPMNVATYWWMGFIVLTILGERYGFSRMLKPSLCSKSFFALSNGLVVAGAALALANPSLGAAVLGVGLMLGTYWVTRHDISLRSIRHSGLPRYVAVSVQSGAVWLAIGGAMLILHRDIAAGSLYDVAVHAVFVGFAFSMIFGHAPLIFPSILKIPLQYNRFYYVPLVLLHASLILRVASDLSGWTEGRKLGAILNAAAILLFFATNAVSAARSRGNATRQS